MAGPRWFGAPAGVLGVLLLLSVQLALCCKHDDDCSLNGRCATSRATCICEPGWKGKSCSVLDLLPVPASTDGGVTVVGLRQLNVPVSQADPTPSNRSSWGGGGWYDDIAKKWFMFASEISNNCGMAAWTSNSETIVASSADPVTLPFVKERTAFGVWTHESVVTRGPKGEYVAFMSYSVPQTRPVCTTCGLTGATNASCPEPGATATRDPPGKGGLPRLGISSRDPTYMSWIAQDQVLEGNWSAPVLVGLAAPQMDTNFAAAIRQNGSLVGLWRDHHLRVGVKAKSTIHLVKASDWKDNSTYVFSTTDLLFSDSAAGLGNPGGVEDPFVYFDKNGNFHALFHNLYPAHPYSGGGHAFSRDGTAWTWTGKAFDNANVTRSDGLVGHYNGDRPKLLFGRDGTTPIALTNGVGAGFPAGGPGMDADQAFTLLQPLASSATFSP